MNLPKCSELISIMFNLTKETLDKMQDRIEGASWETENDP